VIAIDNLSTQLTAGLYFSLFLSAMASILVAHRNLRASSRHERVSWVVLGAIGASALATATVLHDVRVVVVPVLLATTACGVVWRPLENYTAPGRLLLATLPQQMLVTTAWWIWFLCSQPMSQMTRAFLLASLPLGVGGLVLTLFMLPVDFAVTCRRRWLKPKDPLPPLAPERCPKVSLHVPCCSEPPEMVIDTLNALSRLRYLNFEVIVVDNNTTDAELWRPVERHCRRLGDRFRFFHVDRLVGAKAGALNLARRHTAADATIVGIIDSDYQVHPDFLVTLVGYFDDPGVALVQTPHDSRNGADGLFVGLSHWADRSGYLTDFRNINEFGLTYCVGTMCLIRKAALDEAGPWSETCLTEDSEMTVRLHALGWSCLGIWETFGRGLIPETFLDLKKQWFRWEYGHCQNMLTHWRLFLPGPLGRASRMRWQHRFFHLMGLLGVLYAVVDWLWLPLGMIGLLSLMGHRERVPVPSIVWWSVVLMFGSSTLLRWLPYRTAGYGTREMLCSDVALAALTHTRQAARVRFWFGRRKPAWQRTNKFSDQPSPRRALGAARAELVLGILLSALGIVLATHATYSPPDLLALGAAATVWTALAYVMAPVVALIGEWELGVRRSTGAVAAPSAALASEPAGEP